MASTTRLIAYMPRAVRGSSRHSTVAEAAVASFLPPLPAALEADVAVDTAALPPFLPPLPAALVAVAVAEFEAVAAAAALELETGTV
jgi:hypothetical protein